MRANRNRAGTAFYNPNYHLQAFSLRNPMVQWAVSHGAYGMVEIPICAKDFGSAEDLALARRVIPPHVLREGSWEFQFGGLR